MPVAASLAILVPRAFTFAFTSDGVGAPTPFGARS